MPGKTARSDFGPGQQQPHDAAQCKRCQMEEGRLVVRNELLGWDCFSRYLHTKAIKRMESYKLRKSTTAENAPKLLLSLSNGPSSLTLLHILDEYLHAQVEKPTRSPFFLVVLIVETDGYENRPTTLHQLDRMKTAYGSHRFVTRPLSDALKCVHLFQLLDDSSESVSQESILSSWLLSLPSASSRQDAVEILKTRLISEIANELGCDGILFGDSTTRLAEKTMSASAKGRAELVPLTLSEGTNPYGVEFRYPMRDVLRKEIISYTQLSDPPLTDLYNLGPSSGHVSASSKNTTIEDLAAQYFESVEEGFPSVISNVVRTSSKLDDAKLSTEGPKCDFCSLPNLADEPVLQKTSDSSAPAYVLRDSSLCYGCTRMVFG